MAGAMVSASLMTSAYPPTEKNHTVPPSPDMSELLRTHNRESIATKAINDPWCLALDTYSEILKLSLQGDQLVHYADPDVCCECVPVTGRTVEILILSPATKLIPLFPCMPINKGNTSKSYQLTI